MCILELVRRSGCKLLPMAAVFAASALSAVPGTASAQWVGGGWYGGWPGADWRWAGAVPEEVVVAVEPAYPLGYPNYGYPAYGYYRGPAYGVPGYRYPSYGDAYAAGYARGFDNGYGRGSGGGYSYGYPGYGYPFLSY